MNRKETDIRNITDGTIDDLLYSREPSESSNFVCLGITREKSSDPGRSWPVSPCIV